MLRLAGLLERRSRVVLVIWLLVVAAAVPFALRQSEDLTGSGFDVPGSGSDEVRRAIESDFPGAGQAQLAVVVVRSDEVTVVPLRVDVGEDRAPDFASELRERLAVGEEHDGVVFHVVGLGAFIDATGDELEEDLAKAEVIGLPITFLILLVAFGSLAAASLPLVLAIASLTVTGALIFAISQSMDIYLFATNLATLVGLGVAIDYSLFILVRYREEIRAGYEPATARARALATSGLAVVFSGATVMASLAALWTVDNAALRSLALGAILVVAVAVLASTTLLLPLLRLLGARAWRPGKVISRVLARFRRPEGTESFWVTWTERVMRRPVLALLTGAGIMLALAWPALGLEIRSGILEQLPADNEARIGFERASEAVGPGATAQAQVLVAFPDDYAGSPDATEARALAVGEEIQRDPAVAAVAEPQLSSDGRAALIAVTPTEQGESEAAKAMVERLREVLPAAAGPDAEVQVGGVPAAQLDYENQISGAMWRILLFVMLVCYVVLVVLLRSLVVPLKAVLVNLLSVGAAYGVLVMVYQWGILGLDAPDHVDPTVPPIVLALVFGLSMDYEVFLLSRIRERYDATGDSRRSVAEGLASSAGPITSAAAIMVAVFLTFVAAGIPAIQMVGLGGAVAVTLDATIVRLVLVPATMTLLGDRNWWLPAWLEKRLPESFEQLPAGQAARARDSSSIRR